MKYKLNRHSDVGMHVYFFYVCSIFFYVLNVSYPALSLCFPAAVIVLTHLACFPLSLINIPLLVDLLSVFPFPLCQFIFLLCFKHPSIIPVIITVPWFSDPCPVYDYAFAFSLTVCLPS